jgi:hypothetical protein
MLAPQIMGLLLHPPAQQLMMAPQIMGLLLHPPVQQPMLAMQSPHFNPL